MRRSVRVAGRRLVAAGAAAVATLFAGCTAPLAQPPAVADARVAALLIPQATIAGGFATPADLVPGRLGTGAYVKLVHPSALAASGPDLFVADSGLGALLRIDTITQSVATIAALPLLPGTALTTGPDGSVYVLRPDSGTVVRLSREGVPLARFASPPEILQPAGLVIEPTLNRLWISDGAGGVFAFHPSGRMAEPIVGRGDGFARTQAGATVLGAGGLRVAGIDPQCRCVIVLDRDGRPIARVGEGELVLPVALALDDFGRAWVMDRGDGRLKVFDADRAILEIAPVALALGDITAITIDRQQLYLADGPGGRIAVFALLAPKSRVPQ